MAIKDLTGKRFGRLIVVTRLREGIHTFYICNCDCGKTTKVFHGSLTQGATKSCGCLKAEVTAERNRRNIIHGESHTSLYHLWRTMINRCCNTNATGYKHYGGRGIIVCDRWRKSFVAFRDDMGARHNNSYSIHRINNDGNYEPGNCKWATHKEQNHNKRNCVMLTKDGQTMNIAEWARALGVPYRRLISRHKRGWPPDRILA